MAKGWAGAALLAAAVLPAGRNTKKFSGQIGRKKLATGSYRATLVARDAAGNRSKAKQLAFKVVAP